MIKYLGSVSNEGSQGGSVIDPNYSSFTISACTHGYAIGNIVVEDKMNVKIIGCMDNTMDNTFESANRVYDKDGLCPTIPTCCGGGHEPKIIEKTVCIGGFGEKKSNGGTQYYQQDGVYKGDIALAQPAGISDGSYNYLIDEDIEVEKENGFFEQAVKTAAKGNAEVGDTVDAFNEKVNKDGISPTITTRPEGKKTAILPVVPGKKKRYRIRKLIPIETWRLMGYLDDDYEKGAKVNSFSQLYKQAGNAIVKQVLMAIYLQLNIQGKKSWNDMTVEEREQLVRSTSFQKKTDNVKKNEQ